MVTVFDTPRADNLKRSVIPAKRKIDVIHAVAFPDLTEQKRVIGG
jgi:hypothetical protein